MTSVREHYEDHLGPIYTWMLGDFESAVDSASSELESLGLDGTPSGVAVDLGSGPGVYSLALALLGYEVRAIDTCARLVEELNERARGLAGPSVEAIEADMMAFRQFAPPQVPLIVCAGDTLPHLADETEVDALFVAVDACLMPGGTFVATFRDYTSPLTGAQRFIPVRQDDERILTCFLEFGERTVRVHDILHERVGATWQLRVSSYSKLRLPPDWARQRLEDLGLQARLEAGQRGMTRLVATKV